jgi:hypothetical protein
MIWIGSENICGRDEIWINTLIRKSDDKIKFETNIRSWDLIIALGMDVKVWTGLMLHGISNIFGLLRRAKWNFVLIKGRTFISGLRVGLVTAYGD